MPAESLLGLITGTSGAIVVLAVVLSLMLADKLHTDSEFQREVNAHAETRKALMEMTKAKETADERAAVAIESSRVVAESFIRARERRARS